MDKAFSGEARQIIRKQGIAARDSIDREIRKNLSAEIAKKIISSEEFKSARTIMLYKAVRGEVSLEYLEHEAKSIGKRMVYPLCINKTEMIALLPNSENAWETGSYGILEPIRKKSTLIKPTEIDLVICPGTVFDENCHRMGMGAGYYDRFLSQCTNAHIVMVAFEVQKVIEVPTDSWDRPMEKIFTEKAVYLETDNRSD